MSPRIYSTRWLVLLCVVYAAHLVDERYYWIGTADFATRYLGIHFTNTAWWAVNVPSIVLFSLAGALVARGTWPQWVALSLAVHLALHGLGRLPTSIWTREVAPGLVSGLLLCTPVAAVTFWRGYESLSRWETTRGVVVGVASFQPLWHFALLPFLPAPSATA